MHRTPGKSHNWAPISNREASGTKLTLNIPTLQDTIAICRFSVQVTDVGEDAYTQSARGTILESLALDTERFEAGL
jgi:hypothetical protein